MKHSLSKLALVSSFALASMGIFAQDINPIITAVPSLAIAPDARGGGMGDIGAATSPDVYSQHWNPAKYAFATSKAGAGLSYTPWLRKIVNDIALMNAVGYYKIGDGDNQALSASVRYFSVGEIQLADAQGVFGGSVAPYEMAVDFGYSRKLTNTFSGAVAIRYIRADYSTAEDGSAGSTFAADIAGYNESYINIGQSESLLGLGFNISNIGGKISNNGGANGETSYFIPANLRLGASLMYRLDEMNTLTGSVDLNKLLVPTRPLSTDPDYDDKIKKYNDQSSIGGIFKSFSDAPGGFSEEMKEITWSAGLEYAYDQKFKVRTGYFHESQMKGNRQFWSFGAGFKMKIFQLDAAYLLSSGQSNPLDQTLRFSLAFNFDDMKEMLR